MMEKQSFFSIIIPTLNEEQFLPRLLGNLSKQTEQSFEVIIVDGKSDDKTKEKALSFKKKLPRLSFYSVSKQNVSYQRNFGAGKARGEYLVFFDADTQIPVNYLSTMKNATSQKAQFLTTLFATDSTNTQDRLLIRFINLILGIGKLIGKPIAIGGNTIILKKVFARVGGFDDCIAHAEDFEFTQKVKKEGVGLIVLKNPRFIFSLRRYHKEGRIKVLAKNALAAIHVLLKGSITNEFFSYPMGGRGYKN